MSKSIHLHLYKSGRVRRWGYYDDLRGAFCASGLLREWGWNVGEVKFLPDVNKYKVFAEAIFHRPTIDRYVMVSGPTNMIKSFPKKPRLRRSR